ncbi:ABC transporter permease [Labrys wisconsinensis]|uniref:Ribose transport system permease protein n=1 Tax=Labrys wisconsinensis TaxID=425677 RepID=A0ABU0JHW3_9HYPH|nr:ABC transporter permease [Labrys wisconsinensis]MDQ0473876.1 ribose transport system permease protein [Labrys wisconsinensis]
MATAAAETRTLTAARLRALAPLIVLAGLCLIVGALNPNFLTPANAARVLTAAAVPLVLAMGATFVILIGGVDLSVEGTMALGAITLALTVQNDANDLAIGLFAIPLAILVGAAMGAVGGAVHVGLRIPSFMVTLGIWFIGLGIAAVLLGGGTVRILDPSIRALSLTRFLGLPLLVWIAAAALAVAYLVESHTRLGRHAFAVGGGEDLAALSGIPIGRIKVMVFALAGAFYGLASVLAAAQLGQGNATIGDGRLFMTITAVVVGGTSLMGGQGGVLNTLVGVLIVAVLANGMILLGIPPYAQQTAQGLMIIAAVALSLDRAKLRIVK